MSFVGSTPIARHVFERGHAPAKRVQALGGAKNHAVVLPDADLDATADALIGAGFGSAGERCMAISAVVVVGDADPLVEAVATRARGLRTGPGNDPASDMGPLITRVHRDRVAGYVDAAAGRRRRGGGGRPGGHGARRRGGVLLRPDPGRPGDPGHGRLPGRDLRPGAVGPAGGHAWTRPSSWSTPTRTATAPPSSPGTARSARRFRRDVSVGMVGINVAIPVPMAYYSFGGWKQSLFGDAHIHGMEGVRFNTRLKSITTRWPDAQGGHRRPRKLPPLPLGRQALTSRPDPARSSPPVATRPDAVDHGPARSGERTNPWRSTAAASTIHVEVHGTGRPVLLLHGFPDSGALWRHQVPALADAGFRVIVPDLRGFGASDAPEGVEAYYILASAGDVVAVLDQLGVDRAHVVGHDFGAALAWAMASFLPDRVDHLAALSVGQPRRSGRPGSSRWRSPGTCSSSSPRASAERVAVGRRMGQLPRRGATTPTPTPSSPGGRPPGPSPPPSTGTGPTSLPRLGRRRPWSSRRCRRPTMGVWSSGDFALTERQMSGSGAYVSGPWRYERIEGPGHWMPLEAPDEVNRAAARLPAGLSPAPPGRRAGPDATRPDSLVAGDDPGTESPTSTHTVDVDGPVHYADYRRPRRRTAAGRRARARRLPSQLGGGGAPPRRPATDWSPLDLVGHGRTPAAHRTPDIDGHVALVAGFVEPQVADRPVILVGNSLGGLVAALCAAAVPGTGGGTRPGRSGAADRAARPGPPPGPRSTSCCARCPGWGSGTWPRAGTGPRPNRPCGGCWA